MRSQIRPCRYLELGGMSFLIGMDVVEGHGWVKLHSSTYIRGMCVRYLEYPVEEYDRVSTPSHTRNCSSTTSTHS